MRLWYVNPQMLCRQHLLGEHNETHMFVGSMIKGIRLDTYVETNLFSSGLLYIRHDMLAKEMRNRGGVHASPIIYVGVPERYNAVVDFEASLEELLSRCTACKHRMDRMLSEGGKHYGYMDYWQFARERYGISS